MIDEIRQQRRGLFTGSQYHRLMAGSAGYLTCDFTNEHTCYERVKNEDGFIYVPVQEAPKGKKTWKKDDTFLPEGAKTYVIEKVAELIDSEQREFYTSRAMQDGIDNELFAVEHYELQRGIKLAHTGDEQVFFNNGEHGSTPDGVVYNDDFEIVEVHDFKCPIAETHIFNRLYVKTAADLLKHYPEYYWQGIGQMLDTGAEVFKWHSYRQQQDVQIHTVCVSWRQTDIDALKNRLSLAIKLKHKIIQELMA